MHFIQSCIRSRRSTPLARARRPCPGHGPEPLTRPYRAGGRPLRSENQRCPRYVFEWKRENHFLFLTSISANERSAPVRAARGLSSSRRRAVSSP